MNTIIFTLLFALLTLNCGRSSASSTPSSTCTGYSCPAGTDSCCPDVVKGAVCYDANIASCPVGSQGRILCGFQEHGEDFACGTVCYDRTDYICCNDVIYNRNASGIPCTDSGNPTSSPSTSAPSTASPTQSPSSSPSPTQSPSSSPSPSPSAPICRSTCADVVCPTDQSCCVDMTNGPICYRTNVQTCLQVVLESGSGSGSTSLVCLSHESACNTTCYDILTHQCLGGSTIALAHPSSSASQVTYMCAAATMLLVFSLLI